MLVAVTSFQLNHIIEFCFSYHKVLKDEGWHMHIAGTGS